jgi:hypothetical protein
MYGRADLKRVVATMMHLRRKARLTDTCDKRIDGHMYPIGEPSVVFDQRSALRQMTPEHLLQLGTCQVVYLKAAMHDGEKFFVLYAADGLPLAVVDAIETAMEMVAEQGRTFASVH